MKRWLIVALIICLIGTGIVTPRKAQADGDGWVRPVVAGLAVIGVLGITAWAGTKNVEVQEKTNVHAINKQADIRTKEIAANVARTQTASHNGSGNTTITGGGLDLSVTTCVTEDGCYKPASAPRKEVISYEEVERPRRSKKRSESVTPRGVQVNNPEQFQQAMDGLGYIHDHSKSYGLDIRDQMALNIFIAALEDPNRFGRETYSRYLPDLDGVYRKLQRNQAPQDLVQAVGGAIQFGDFMAQHA